MKKTTIIFILAGITFLGSFGSAHSEVKAYLYLSGINGESKNPNYPNWIELLTFSWQISNTSTINGGGAGAGRSIVRPLIVKKLIDKSSAPLFLRVLIASHIYEGILALQQQGGNPYEVLRIKMGDIIITNITSDTNSGLSAEAVALDFGKFCYKYTPLKADGSPDSPVEQCFSIVTNQIISPF